MKESPRSQVNKQKPHLLPPSSAIFPLSKAGLLEAFLLKRVHSWSFPVKGPRVLIDVGPCSICILYSIWVLMASLYSLRWKDEPRLLLWRMWSILVSSSIKWIDWTNWSVSFLHLFRQLVSYVFGVFTVGQSLTLYPFQVSWPVDKSTQSFILFWGDTI